MAKEMPFKLFRSSVSGNIPATIDMNYGELALNYADGKLFFKDSSNNIQVLASSSYALETEFNFSNSTTAADPGSGNLRLNDSTFAASVEIYLDSISYLGSDIAVLLAPMRINDLIILYSKTAPTNFAKYRLIAASTDNTGWWTLQVTLVESSGAFWANATKLMAVVEHADSSTGTGKVARQGSPELSSPILSSPIVYDPGFYPAVRFRDAGGLYDLHLLTLNPSTADKFLFIPDGGDVGDYQTLARLSDIPAPVATSIARTFAFMGA